MFRLGRLVVSLLVVLAVGLIAACSDSTGPTPIEADTGASPLLGGLLEPRFVSCTPQPEVKGSALIGPQGGAIRAGKHKVTFPAGALTKTLLITVRVPSDTVNQVVFGPEGLKFPLGHEPRLELSYKHCQITKATAKRIVYTDDRLQVQERLLTVDDVLSGEAEAGLKHFSRYALMY